MKWSTSYCESEGIKLYDVRNENRQTILYTEKHFVSVLLDKHGMCKGIIVLNNVLWNELLHIVKVEVSSYEVRRCHEIYKNTL